MCIVSTILLNTNGDETYPAHKSQKPIVGILTFMSRKNFMLSLVAHDR